MKPLGHATYKIGHSVAADPLCITVVGTKGVGKTTFLSCMYYNLSANIDSGRFEYGLTVGEGLSSEVRDLDEKLTRRYGELIDNPSTPGQPTAAFLGFTLGFEFKEERVLNTSWFDYDGEWLGKDRAKNSSDIDDLFKRFENSDCPIILVDGSLLKNAPDAKRLKDEKKFAPLRDVKLVLQRVLKEGRCRSFVVVVTKFDLCGRRGDGVLEDIRTVLLPELFQGDRVTFICPFSVGNLSDPEPRLEPINYDLPLVFAVFCRLQATRRSLLEKAREGLLDSIKSNGSNSQALRDDHTRAIEDLDQLVRTINDKYLSSGSFWSKNKLVDYRQEFGRFQSSLKRDIDSQKSKIGSALDKRVAQCRQIEAKLETVVAALVELQATDDVFWVCRQRLQGMESIYKGSGRASLTDI